MTHTFREDQYETENVLESSVLVDNEVVWAKDSEEQIILRYNDEGGISLMDTTGDPYLSVDEDNTQYFSVADSNKIVLGELEGIDNIQENSEPIEQIDDEHVDIEVGGQPLIFRMEGTDDIFALQVVCDDDGNLQKYQYRLRLDENDEYKCVPESVELLPPDADISLEQFQLANEQNEPVDEPEEIQVVKQEQNDHDKSVYVEVTQYLSEEEDKVEEGGTDEETNETVILKHCEDVKTESDLPEENIKHPIETTQSLHLLLDSNAANAPECADLYHATRLGGAEHLLPSMHVVEEIEEEERNLTETDLHQQLINRRITDDESDPDDFQIDPNHINADTDIQRDFLYTIDKSPHVFRIQSEIDKRKHVTRSVSNYPYFVIANTEKENMRTVPYTKLMKPNPRSILKTSVMPQETEIKVEIDKKMRGKQSPAKQFHNLLARTTILQAPVRHERLPRKQQIKPVQRADEEIIVQEVVVSSRGYETPFFDLRRKNPVISEIVQLSDSDYDYNPRKQKIKKRRSRRGKFIEIIISDSEDETEEEIVDLSQDSDDEGKRNRRGRPRKKKGPVKKLLKSQNIQVEWKCTKCPKLFPSEGSLKSHMAFHKFPQPKKYECSKCGENFRTLSQLTKHTKEHETVSKSLECPLCKKMFKNRRIMSNHKRRHVKKHLLEFTLRVRYSTKLRNSRARAPPDKRSKSHSQHQNRCSRCNLICLSKLHLENHQRIQCTKVRTQSVKKQ